jgi:hypothetical protein
VSKNRIEVDLSFLIEKWAGNPDNSLPGTHSGGDLQDLRSLLDERFGSGKNRSDIIPRMKLYGKTLISQPYRHDPKSNVQEFKVLQGDVIRSALASVPFPLYDFDPSEALFVVNPNSCLI